jgi:hypothetical protein
MMGTTINVSEISLKTGLLLRKFAYSKYDTPKDVVDKV